MLQKFIIVICLLFPVGVSGILAQDKSSPDEIIKIDTTLVSVPVIVSDREGRFVANLQAADFTIYQDGTKQKIDFFAATEEPLTIALLIDTSHSTREVLDNIKDAAQDFIKLLQPPDKALIVSFDYAPHVLSPLTSDREQLKRAVKNADIGEYAGTALRDAVFNVVNQSFAGIKGRKAIILLTDGKDAGSQVSIADLLYSLEETDTMIYSVFYQTGRFADRNVVDFPPSRRGGVFGGRFPRRNNRLPPFPDDRRRDNPQRRERAEQRRERIEQKNEAAEIFLQSLSDTTAGRFYSNDVRDLKKTFGKIVEELRYQYRIGFYPPPEEKSAGILHQLKVKVARPETLVVRARRNYRVQSKSAAN
jgi:VWFA-related protein